MRSSMAWICSSWRLAFNGAEPVSAETVERFAARFAALRLSARSDVHRLWSGRRRARRHVPAARTGAADRSRESQRTPARRRREAGHRRRWHALRVVSCGVPLPGHEVRVVNAAGRELPEREQGRIQFRGPSATKGYYGNAAANAALFEGDWLNTGDLGYFAAGELYLTGREKDIIVRRGANIHPAELEAAVANLCGVRKGGVAVFPATDRTAGAERLVVLAEVRATDAGERSGSRRRLRNSRSISSACPPTMSSLRRRARC